MKTTATFFRRGAGALAGLAALLCLHAAHAAGTVDTVGGGPYAGNLSPFGYTDGDTAVVSQFNGPSGLAFDSTGNFLFVADRTNNAVRKLDLPNNRTTSFASNNHSQVFAPVDLVLDGADNVYVLNRANGTNGFIAKFNKYRNFITNLVTGLTNATALTIDGNTNLFVIERGGAIKRVTRTGAVTNLARLTFPGVRLQGIALTDTGNLVVSDANSNAIWQVNLISGNITLLTGGNGPGDGFGDPAYVQFNQPEHITRAGDGSFVVADRGNNRVKLVDVNGIVTPLYGMNSNLWLYPPFAAYPGW